MKAAGITLAVVAGFVGLSLVGSALNLITIPWLQFNSKVQTNRDIVTKTYNADNALYNYHWFKEKAEEINSTEKKIADAKTAYVEFDAAAGERKDWKFEDKTESARLHAVYNGTKSAYNDLVAIYNAHANEVDRAVFQDNLPLFFNIK